MLINRLVNVEEVLFKELESIIKCIIQQQL